MEHYESYEDDDYYVVCDVRNPDSWIRATTTWELEP